MKVSIHGSEFSFEQEVSADQAKQLIVNLLGTHAITPDFSPPSQMLPTSVPHVREVLAVSRAKRAPDKIVVFGCFLKAHKGLDFFGRSELVQCFEQALEPVPKNLSRDLVWGVRIGWLAIKSDKPGCYYVTSGGEAAVKNGFAKVVISKTTVRGVGRK